MFPAEASRWQGGLARLCVIVPLLMLAANVLAWLRWGTDLPFLDDWRAYNQGVALSWAPGHLFQAVNNTISPVGIALDVLAQRWLGGNPLPYQTLSMLGVLGSLLWLQWRLLGWVVPEAPARQLLFLLTIFMLQSGSYWGEQSLAYHQALPLVALLGAAWLGLVAKVAPLGRLMGCAALGLVAGLSYVSGAVGAVTMGCAWVLWSLLIRGNAQRPAGLVRRSLSSGVALAWSGVLALALQLWLTRRPDVDARGQGMRLTWPTDTDFWWYAAGKLGRSTGRGFSAIGLEATWVAAWVLALLVVLLLLLTQVFSSRTPSALRERMDRLALVFLPLLAVVSAYLALVSLGRASLRPASVQGAGEVFQFAYGRFHFFWLTLLLPWLGAVPVVMLACRGSQWQRRPRLRATDLLMAVVVILGTAWVRGVFDVAEHYRSASQFRAGEIRCLSRQLGSGQPVSCPGFDAVDMPDWTRAYNHGRAIDASFVRYFPIVERDGFGHELLRAGGGGDHAAVRWLNTVALPDGWRRGEQDPQMLLSLASVGPALADCRVLGVQIKLQAEVANTAQLFYRHAGQKQYAEARSVRKNYQPGADDEVWLEFTLDSAVGFDPELRLDPAEGDGRWRLKDWRVTCRLRANA